MNINITRTVRHMHAELQYKNRILGQNWKVEEKRNIFTYLFIIFKAGATGGAGEIKADNVIIT